MPNQVTYKTNADYDASYKNLSNSNLVASIDQTKKSFLIRFRLKGQKTFCTLSPNGSLTIKWDSLEEKQTLLKVVQNLLVPKEGEPLTVEPVFQQLWVHYPPAGNFGLYWCDEKLNYRKIIHNPYLSKKERHLWNLQVEGYELLTKMFLETENVEGSLFGAPLFLVHEPETMTRRLRNTKT